MKGDTTKVSGVRVGSPPFLPTGVGRRGLVQKGCTLESSFIQEREVVDVVKNVFINRHESSVCRTHHFRIVYESINRLDLVCGEFSLFYNTDY